MIDTRSQRPPIGNIDDVGWSDRMQLADKRLAQKEWGQVPLCKAPYGPFRQRYLTPF